MICGALTYVVLALTGVPFAAVIALLVAVADLIPLVGATLGAVIAAGAGFLHSPTAGVVVLVFFVLYQQLENHLLQPLILSRAVRLNPLTVLVSVLLAAELAGLLGALLAIPAAGIVADPAPRVRPAPAPARPAGRSGPPVGAAGRIPRLTDRRGCGRRQPAPPRFPATGLPAQRARVATSGVVLSNGTAFAGTRPNWTADRVNAASNAQSALTRVGFPASPSGGTPG